jgi:hypothetical protein
MNEIGDDNNTSLFYFLLFRVANLSMVTFSLKS